MDPVTFPRYLHWPQAGFLVGAYAGLCGLIILAVARASATSGASPVPSEALGPWQAVAFLVAAILVGAIIIRRVKARAAWELILGATLFLGVWFYLWVLFSGEVGLVAAAIVTLLQAWVRKVWIHNAFILLGAAGVALNFAFLLPTRTVAILLVVLAVYDTFAVRGKNPAGSPMVRFASSLVHRGIVPGLVIPGRFRGILASTSDAVVAPDATFLGAGDLILPVTLVVVAAVVGIVPALMVTLGILLAAAWLGSRGPTKPFPALLPLALGAGVPYLALMLFHVV